MALYTKDYRISSFFTVCAVMMLVLLVSLLFPKTTTFESVSTSSVLGSELTHALHTYAEKTNAASLNADVTLFLLPPVDEALDFTELLSAPLYGFYLTGKELCYLPEYYASLSDSFPVGIPYTGGLSFTYNPHRIIYNRATDISLQQMDGTLSPIAGEKLYYVIGNDLAFSMFHYLSERTFHLINICPKDAFGRPIADFSGQLLRGQNGSHTLLEVYKSYLVEASAASYASVDGPGNASVISRCTSRNASALFSSLNIAGFFVLGCAVLFLGLAYLLRPYFYHIYIRFRVFRAHRRKRGKATFQLRLMSFRKKQSIFFKKLLTNRAA